jgi:hypothetical protein
MTAAIFLLKQDLGANASRLSRGKNRFPLFRIMLYLLAAAFRASAMA